MTRECKKISHVMIKRLEAFQDDVKRKTYGLPPVNNDLPMIRYFSAQKSFSSSSLNAAGSSDDRFFRHFSEKNVYSTFS